MDPKEQETYLRAQLGLTMVEFVLGGDDALRSVRREALRAVVEILEKRSSQRLSFPWLYTPCLALGERSPAHVIRRMTSADEAKRVVAAARAVRDPIRRPVVTSCFCEDATDVPECTAPCHSSSTVDGGPMTSSSVEARTGETPSPTSRDLALSTGSLPEKRP